MYIYDPIAGVLTGIGHVILYLLLIRHNRMPYKIMITLSLIFTVLLGVVVTVTGYPEWNSILSLLFLLSLGLMQNNISFMQNLYFAFVSLISITFTKIFFVELVFQLFMLSPFNLYLWTTGVIHLLVTIVIVIGIFLWRKQIQYFAEYIEESKLYYISYGLLFIGFILSLILTAPSTRFLAVVNERYGEISVIAAFILFMILLLIAIIGAYLAKERLMQEQEEKLNEERLDYVEKLEFMHTDLASFRHDYMNILLALDTSVRAKNLQQIEEIYYGVIAPTSTLMNNHELDIVKFSHIKIPEVKSVLSVKVIAAQQQDIKVMVDIPQVIENLKMPIIDFIRVMSILVDNAMEESIVSDEKNVQIAFFEMDRDQYFIVKNSCQQKEININRLYEKHYSSKNGKRGYGLFSLKRMLGQMDTATLETTFIAPYFTQTLILKGKS